MVSKFINIGSNPIKAFFFVFFLNMFNKNKNKYYKIIFVRKSLSSFKIYVKKNHKICSVLCSGQYYKSKFNNKIKDIFVRFNSKKFKFYYFSNLIFYNKFISNFENFIFYGRT